MLFLACNSFFSAAKSSRELQTVIISLVQKEKDVNEPLVRFIALWQTGPYSNWFMQNHGTGFPKVLNQIS